MARRDDRAKVSSTYRKKISISKITSMHSFEETSPEQILEQSNMFLNNIKNKEGDLTSNLCFLCACLRRIHEFNYTTKFHILNKFCDNFPYSDFFQLVIDEETPEICTLSLNCFSYCSNSKKFPRDSFVSTESVEFILNLFTKIAPKYHKHLFNILNECICNRPDIRDLILKSDILDYFKSTKLKREYQYSNTAIEFLSTCLSFEPDIDKNVARAINLILILSVQFLQYQQEKTKESKISALKTILPILYILPRRKGNQCQTIYNADLIDQALLYFIFNDIASLNLIETFIPILENASIVDLGDNEFITLVMNFIGKVTDKHIIRYCMKILNEHAEQWRSHPQISEYILSILSLKKDSFSFISEQSLVRILLSYTNIFPQMNIMAVEYAFKFISDTEIGSICIQFIFHSFTSIFGTSDSNENKEYAKTLYQLNLNNLEEIAFGNENDIEAGNFAISIMEVMNKSAN